MLSKKDSNKEYNSKKLENYIFIFYNYCYKWVKTKLGRGDTKNNTRKYKFKDEEIKQWENPERYEYEYRHFS